MKLKLLFVLPEWRTRASDHSLHIIELLRYLECETAEVEAFVMIERGRGPISVFPPGRLSYLNLSGRSLRGASKVLWAVLRARAKGCRHVYVHYSFYGGIVGGLVMRLTGGRLWYWNCARVGDYLVPREGSRWTLREKLFFELPLKVTLHLATFLVTGSCSMARHYAESMGIAPERIRVMPNWINLERFAPPEENRRTADRRSLGIHENDLTVLFVHRLAHRKGADLLPGLIEKVRESVPGAHLLAAGEGPLLESLASEIARRGLENRLRLLGPVPNREIPALYHVADLLVVPSREEGFPHVLLEAMAAGVPFVATDVGGIREVTSEFQHTCLVPPGDLTQFADRVVALLQDEPIRQKLAKEGSRHVDQFALPKVAQRFLSLLSEGG